MTSYEKGWCFALVKLGLAMTPSLGATSGTTLGAKTEGPASNLGTKSQQKPWQWSAQNNIEPKLHETAWSHAQKDLDTGESRVMAKFDASQRQPQLPVGG